MKQTLQCLKGCPKAASRPTSPYQDKASSSPAPMAQETHITTTKQLFCNGRNVSLMGNLASIQPLLKQEKNQRSIPNGAEKHRTKVSLAPKPELSWGGPLKVSPAVRGQKRCWHSACKAAPTQNAQDQRCLSSSSFRFWETCTYIR